MYSLTLQNEVSLSGELLVRLDATLSGFVSTRSNAFVDGSTSVSGSFSLGLANVLGKTELDSSLSVLGTLVLRSGASIRRHVELASYLSLRSFTRVGSGRFTGAQICTSFSRGGGLHR